MAVTVSLVHCSSFNCIAVHLVYSHKFSLYLYQIYTKFSTIRNTVADGNRLGEVVGLGFNPPSLSSTTGPYFYLFICLGGQKITLPILINVLFLHTQYSVSQLCLISYFGQYVLHNNPSETFSASTDLNTSTSASTTPSPSSFRLILTLQSWQQRLLHTVHSVSDMASQNFVRDRTIVG